MSKEESFAIERKWSTIANAARQSNSEDTEVANGFGKWIIRASGKCSFRRSVAERQCI